MLSEQKKLDKHHDSFGYLQAAQMGLNKTIKVRCKNMMSYDLAFATDRT